MKKKIAFYNYHSQKTSEVVCHRPLSRIFHPDGRALSCARADLWVRAFDRAGVNSHVMMGNGGSCKCLCPAAGVYTTVKSPRTHTRSCVQLFLPDSYKYKGCLRTLVGCSVYVSDRLGLLFQHYKAPKHKSVTAGTTGREIHALSHDLEDSYCPNLLLFFWKTLRNDPYRSQPGTSDSAGAD